MQWFDISNQNRPLRVINDTNTILENDSIKENTVFIFNNRSVLGSVIKQIAAYPIKYLQFRSNKDNGYISPSFRISEFENSRDQQLYQIGIKFYFIKIAV